MTFSPCAEDPRGWQTIAREVHFDSPHLTVATEEVRTPANRSPHRWTIVHRKAAAVVAPMTADGKLVLIQQERIPIRAAIWEAPGGQVDDASENDADEIAAVALRELREETGYQLAAGGELIPLGDFFSSPGFTNEHTYFLLARPVTMSAEGHSHQESESILDCRAFTPAEVAVMIAENEIRDANTLGLCSKLVARGLLKLHVKG